MLRLILPFEEHDPQLDTLFFMATRPLKGNPYLAAADSSLGTSAARASSLIRSRAAGLSGTVAVLPLSAALCI